MRRYPEVEEQYPGRSMCSIPGAQISDSNTADTAVEGTKLIPRLQVDGGSRAQSNKKISLASCRKDVFVVCWSYAFISRCETCHVLLPIKRGLSNMVDLYGRRKSGVTLTVQVDAYSHQKSSCPITSFDDLLGKSVNSAMNGEIFFLKWSQPFMPLLLILRLLKTSQDCETTLTSQFDSLKKFEKLKKGWIYLIEKKLDFCKVGKT